jgi:enoyl-CoA hydratase
METGTPRLIARKEASVGFMTFNHPERHNALSLDVWEAIPGVLAEFERDPEVRVVVFSGAGEKAFVSGADITQFGSARANQAGDESYAAISGAATKAMEQFPKPSIAMIRGYCIGGGLAVALTCDLRIASDDSRFGIPAARLGLGYRFEGVRKLVSIVGPACASEILFTGRHFDASEAIGMGLINRVVPVSELEASVRATAAQIGDNAPLTVRASKLAIKEALKDPEHRKLDELKVAIAACFNSEDYVEGRCAFAEKRKPQFRGQ